MKHIFKISASAIYILSSLHGTPTYAFEHDKKIHQGYTHSHLSFSRDQHPLIHAEKPRFVAVIDGALDPADFPKLKALKKGTNT